MTEKKCPKCGSRHFQINDYYTRPYIYEVTDGIVVADGVGEEADHVRTHCVCRYCGHKWTPRLFNYTIDE